MIIIEVFTSLSKHIHIKVCHDSGSMPMYIFEERKQGNTNSGKNNSKRNLWYSTNIRIIQF